MHYCIKNTVSLWGRGLEFDQEGGFERNIAICLRRTQIRKQQERDGLLVGEAGAILLKIDSFSPN